MSDEEILQAIRVNVLARMQSIDATNESISLFLQIKILDKLEELRICIIDVEQEVAKLNPLYKE